MIRISRWLVHASRSAQSTLQPRTWHRNLATVVNTVQPPPAREEAIRLRQYQEECIQSVLSYLKDGHKRLGISLATGAGKTVVFTQLIDRIQPHAPHATQTLILAHRRELVEQAAKHCERAYPDKSIDIEMGDARASGVADITVASVRSMISGDRLSKYDPTRFKLVLVDEAHHIVAPGYLQTLEHFGLDMPRNTGPALVGVSATFSRFDGLRLGAAIDHIVYHKDYVDMIGDKWLSDVKFTTIKSNANLARVRSNKEGDFHAAQLSRAVNTNETNEITVRAWIAEAGDRKSTLVFCVDLDHVASLTNVFRQHGIDARYITGETNKRTRGERLEAFKQREFPVLLNCGVFTEGTDMPNIDCVLLARPTKSRNLLVQMIGRGMRLYKDKTDCHVIDMVASLETGIVTVPTLFGLDPSEIVESASAKELKELKDGKVEDSQDSTGTNAVAGENNPTDLSDANLTFTHYDSVHDLIEDTSGERHIRSISPNAWVQVDSHKYILAARSGILTLEKRTPPSQSDPPFHVIWKHALPPLSTSKSSSPWSKPRPVATATTLTTALHAADTFAARKFDRLAIATASPWRRSPASAGQLSVLNNLRLVSSSSDDDDDDDDDDDGDGHEPLLTPADLTKGHAADMITKLKFGARGRFDRLMGVRRKAERREERVRELRAREHVRVGPLNE